MRFEIVRAKRLVRIVEWVAGERRETDRETDRERQIYIYIYIYIYILGWLRKPKL